ncbi:MAG: adenosylmethionine decarboxylase [Spirochaetes bacterium]|nr:adenosylmethionine decarboxylase [Spirochaetota bacterium]MBU1079143.1 adenosylmethionine decarboxylase [Spirochaetota bacterium]
MVRRVKGQKIKLEGFNNLTKSLSFNIYDICYARSKESQIEYLEYIDEEYDSARLEAIVEEVTRIINARLVQVSTQDYDPRGASVVALLNEDMPVAALQAGAPAVVGHLDKSHIAIHTYPEYDQLSGLATFRVDVDIATCGMISPLSALHYLIESFESEVVIIDYRVRGFTRDSRGTKLFIDHDISSIQDYIAEDVLDDYVAYDVNIVSDNNFHTKMRKKELRLRDFLFGDEVTSLVPKENKRIKAAIDLEVQEIFECKDLGRRMGRP